MLPVCSVPPSATIPKIRPWFYFGPVLVLAIVSLWGAPAALSQSSAQILPMASGISNGGPATAVSRGTFSTVGFGVHVGLGGGGFDVAAPLAQRFNLRVGADFFSYSSNFVEQGANVAATLQLRSGHALLDWFPFGNSFHVSPMLNFADNNKVRATVLVPPGTTVTLNGTDYVSSSSDPLHGSGSVDFRKTAPGLTVGFGNLVPRARRHFSFPVELGFYYIGQPTLKVAFTGSACVPNVPQKVGCESVDADQDFQQSLAAFRARNNHNLSYGEFFPVFSTGVGYRF